MSQQVPREWDAKTYDSLPLPHQQWGRRTIGRLKLSGDETVIDAGCGTGRDTAALLDLLPGGRVVAIDGSTKMLDQLRTRLAGRADAERVEIIHADLTGTWPTDVVADAAISVATFHWIHDHETLFANVAAHLRPGGQFVAECGGQGNVASVSAAVREVLGEFPDVWHFAGIDDTTRRLETAGFTDVDVALVPYPARLEPGEQLRSYLGTVVLGAHLDRLPPDRHRPFVQAVAAKLPEPVVDYVRLQFSARRA
jgi:trans-aconitate 2-methyltransferase